MGAFSRLLVTHRPIRSTALLLLVGALVIATQDRPTAQQQLDTIPVFPKIALTTGRSIILTTEFDVIRLAITNPGVADATVVQPREILLDGKAPGTVSLILWGPSERLQYDVVVEQPISTLEQQLHALYPGEDVTIGTSEGATILSGRVSSTNVMMRMGEITAASLPKTQLINLLQVPGGSDTQQVMLQVRFAEVNRRILTQAGLSLIVARSNFVARTTTSGGPTFSAPEGEPATLIFSDLLNLFVFDRVHGVAGVLRALESTGAFQSLAEPNLIAYNNQEASFLAGGEIPIPVVGGVNGNASITYKEFGIRLTFTPTIAGDAIRLKVRPEVSSLDFANGISISGFRIPALITRRAETNVELRDGQSFAIAGLLNNIGQNDEEAIPILSKLPIIGPLFKSKTKRAEQTELMVLITPRLVRPLDPDEVPPLPTNNDQFMKPPTEPGQSGSLDQQLDGAAGVVDAPAQPRP